ncbi:zinc-binding dehydrogenase [Paenibacillus sp. sptzw28]|uniref:zinc-binding dehydrogenase n=1 Tax=Paenibacillus sp. sptzw28 TaxID=715179 RepID=UPI001C6EA560|nr:zinc-binding dehydrogenase [Paenibacillus sp. sptzw28]QYR22563.1 zinc-binding dehydrogenase [Paenibacillus sp. sptzw28]
MKAAVLHESGSPLKVTEVSSPPLRSSSVRVRVLATHILSFTNQVVGGQFPFPLPTPYTPGLCAIGFVEDLADDVSGLTVGQKVFCSPLVSSRNNSGEPERILKGWFGMTANCQDLLDLWKEGTFAEQADFPVECITPIDLIGDDYDNSQLACMYYLCIAYGAFLRGEFKPGQSVLINGATGNLGTASVLTALAMGASRVYAAGRNLSVLESLTELDPLRVQSVPLPQREEEYGSTLSKQVKQVDIMIDAVGIIDSPSLVEAGLSVLRQGGTAVLLGGVAANVHLSYLMTLVKELNIKGSSMYPSSAPSDIVRMIHSGALNLRAFRPKTYPLELINEAIAAASGSRGLDYSILVPWQGDQEQEESR